MNETTARFSLVLMTLANAVMLQLGAFAAYCGTFAFSHNFGDNEEFLIIVALWMYPMVCLASIVLTWRIFRTRRFATAHVVAVLPLAPILIYIVVAVCNPQW